MFRRRWNLSVFSKNFSFTTWPFHCSFCQYFDLYFWTSVLCYSIAKLFFFCFYLLCHDKPGGMWEDLPCFSENMKMSFYPKVLFMFYMYINSIKVFESIDSEHSNVKILANSQILITIVRRNIGWNDWASAGLVKAVPMVVMAILGIFAPRWVQGITYSNFA